MRSFGLFTHPWRIINPFYSLRFRSQPALRMFPPRHRPSPRARTYCVRRRGDDGPGSSLADRQKGGAAGEFPLLAGMLIQAPTLNGGLSRRRRFTERRERACFERANEVEDLKRMPVDLPGRKMGDPRRGVTAPSIERPRRRAQSVPRCLTHQGAGRGVPVTRHERAQCVQPIQPPTASVTFLNKGRSPRLLRVRTDGSPARASRPVSQYCQSA
jgi:hypothetical protein